MSKQGDREKLAREGIGLGLPSKGVHKYMSRPVTKEAIQWTGGNLREIINFTGLHESAQKWTWEEYEKVVQTDGLKIFTDEGPMLASVGDYIIKGLRGEFYPCKPDVFVKSYEPIA